MTAGLYVRVACRPDHHPTLLVYPVPARLPDHLSPSPASGVYAAFAEPVSFAPSHPAVAHLVAVALPPALPPAVAPPSVSGTKQHAVGYRHAAGYQQVPMP